MSPRTCKTCIFAEWQIMANGRPNRRRHGQCTYQIEVTPLPLWASEAQRGLRVDAARVVRPIWVDEGSECETYDEEAR